MLLTEVWKEDTNAMLAGACQHSISVLFPDFCEKHSAKHFTYIISYLLWPWDMSFCYTQLTVEETETQRGEEI